LQDEVHAQFLTDLSQHMQAYFAYNMLINAVLDYCILYVLFCFLNRWMWRHSCKS